MLIQCQSCTHKFRLNLERLPARRTFVRCKNCGTPIYIHGEEEEAAAAGALPESITVPEALAAQPVIPPWMAGTLPEADDGAVLVTCPHCESRYRVPREPLQRPDIRLKCTQCDHVFASPEDLAPAVAMDLSRPVLSPDVVARAAMEPPEFRARHGAAGEVSPGPAMPEPDETRMSALFEDMAPEPGIRRPTGQPGLPKEEAPPGAPLTAEDAYLDAVDLGEAFDRPARGGVPDDQKYRLFLKPGEMPAGRAAQPEPPQEPGAPPAAATETVLPTLDEELPPLEVEPLPPPAPPLATPPPKPGAAPPPAAPRIDAELPPLPILVIEPPRKPPVKQIVADQVGWFTNPRRYTALGVAAAVVLIAAGAWTVWLWNAPGSSQPYTIETGRVHQLALDSDLAGRYVFNKPSGERLFVVQGVVENRFPRDAEISWIRLRGTAYTDPNQTRTLGTAFAFIGNVLTDAQLGAWELDAIQAFHAYNNGRDNANYQIPSGVRVPFQLVFAGISQPVGRTVAQVVSYHRNNLTVYVDTGR